MQRHGKAVQPVPQGVDTMWTVDSQSIEALSRAYQAWFDQAGRMRDEAFRFTQARLTKELDAAMRLSRCMTATEALAVQSAFAKDMAEDYLAEGQRFVDLMGEMTKGLPPKPKAHH